MPFNRVQTISLLISIFIASAVLAEPPVISYQGRLTTNNQTVVDSTYQILFAIYNDSIGGDILWAEVGSVATSDGLFDYMLGQNNPITASMLSGVAGLYLEIQIGGEIISPRTRLASTPFAIVAGNLDAVDSLGIPAVQIDNDSHKMTFYDSSGVENIIIQPTMGDSSLVLPDSAINALEIADEPGIAVTTNIDIVNLTTSIMTDMVKVTVEIPADGYIVLHGKCYLMFSGTVGANTAIVQVDQDEGGSTKFPYYTVAGLSGYTNSGTNYFPVYVTRTYFKYKGTYTFRMEGRASHTLPAEAKSWDHILTAVYYPTSHYGVEAIVSDPSNFPIINTVSIDKSNSIREAGTYYKIDLQQISIEK